MKNIFLILVLAVLAALTVSSMGTAIFTFGGKIPFFGNLSFQKYTYTGGGKYNVGDAELKNEVKSLDIDWVTGSVTVKYHDNDTILISETPNRPITDDLKLRWMLDGDTLTVKYANNGAHLKADMKKELVITLPRSAKTEYAVINNTTGKIIVNGGTWKELDLDTTTGDVNINADSVEKLRTETTTGSINADIVRAGTMELECTTGKINLSAGSFDSLKASVTTGSVTAKLPEAPGFIAKLSTVTGKIKCGLNHTNDGEKYIIGDGSKSVRIETVTGGIEISGYDMVLNEKKF